MPDRIYIFGMDNQGWAYPHGINRERLSKKLIPVPDTEERGPVSFQEQKCVG